MLWRHQHGSVPNLTAPVTASSQHLCTTPSLRVGLNQHIWLNYTDVTTASLQRCSVSQRCLILLTGTKAHHVPVMSPSSHRESLKPPFSRHSPPSFCFPLSCSLPAILLFLNLSCLHQECNWKGNLRGATCQICLLGDQLCCLNVERNGSWEEILLYCC